MNKLNLNEVIEGDIQTIAFGGEGILRHQGFVVFVPFTAVGDRISCRIVEVKKSFAKGELLHVQKPSPQRTNPLCPYFGTCGGCQLQHLNQEAQLNYKLRAVTDALSRIGRLAFPRPLVVPAHLNWAYRRHITLHLRMTSKGVQAGYIGTDNSSLVVVQTCPIFNSSESPVVKHLQEFVQSLTFPESQEGRVTILKNHKGQHILSFQLQSLAGVQPQVFQAALQHYPTFIGMIVQTPQEQVIYGDPYCEQKIEDLIFRFTPQAFIQNNLEQSTNIYRHLSALLSERPSKLILDLYCGFGVTSLLLARQGHHVIGIESNPDAIRFAEENSRLNHIKQAEFIQGDVEKILPKWLKTHAQPDVILMNPPRTGLTKPIIQSLLKARAEEMIYISCMPTTLARDLNLLCKESYTIEQCMIYDMFPQTAHVETFIHLKKK